MNRWLLIGSLAGLLIGSTGCLHHNTRGGCSTGGCATGGCSTGACGGDCGTGNCGTGNCGTGNCGTGNCGNSSGVIGKIGTWCGIGCGCGGGRTGCVTGPIGWQQGGLNYSSHLQPGLCGHNAGAALNNRPFMAGPPTAQTAYPYYSHRGPRDFLLDNPPTIGN